MSQIFIFPTETVYGIGANATDHLAVAKIFALKGRPPTNPLILHVASKDEALKWGIFSNAAHILADTLWPAPITLVVPMTAYAKLHIAPAVTAGHDTIAIRMPDHQLALQLLQSLPFPLAAPSANLSNHLSPTNIQHINAKLLNAATTIIDGGSCSSGLESTIVQVKNENWSILRNGTITADDIFAILKTTPILGTAVSAGQSQKHYAPRHEMLLNQSFATAGDSLLAFGDSVPAGADITLNLSPSGNLYQAASNLFNYLHILDAVKCNKILVTPIPNTGIGIAINERLKKGASQSESGH